MGKDVKFGYILDKTHNFDKKYLKKIDDSHLDDADKFIQIRINGEEYIRVGENYHGLILASTLCEFGLGSKFGTRYNSKNFRIPLEKGDNYELVGSGKVRLLLDKLNFYDVSRDYIEKVKGTNRQNLEAIFGKDKVEQIDKENPFLSFLVKF